MDRSGKITTHTHMQQRIDTAENWTADNPVLYNGEIGYEEQLGTGSKLLPPKVKIGDGVTHWNDLPYQTGDDGNGFITYITPTETINAGDEHVFEYPISERILTQAYEVSEGGTFDNNNIAFDTEEKYLQQNSNCTAIANGKAQLRGSSDGNAVQFDGNSAYGEVPYNAIYAPKSAITVELMAFMTDWNTSKEMALISKTENSGYEIKMNGSGVGSGNIGFMIFVNGKYSKAVAQLSILSPGWHRFTGSLDGRYVKFYVDGKLTGTYDLGNTYSISYTVNNSLIFGADASGGKGPSGSAPTYFSGKLADARIWNVALTDQAVASQAFSELTGSEPGLVGYWKMNEGSGNILNDSSPNKNNATLYKAYSWTSDESFFSNKYSANAPYYIATTDASNYLLSKVISINSVTIPVTTPTNTSVKFLTSFDGRKTWLYHDNSGWHSFGTISSEWTVSNSNTELQDYFTNLSMTRLANDLGYNPQSIDFMFQLETNDLSVTPVVSALTMNYTTVGDFECADVGSYDDTCSRYGLKIASPSQLSVKNKDSVSHTIFVYITPLSNITYLS